MRNVKKDLDLNILNEFLICDPINGKLYWKFRDIKWFKSEGSWKSWNTRCANKEAFTALSHGYRVGRILEINYPAHVIIWVMTSNRWPDPHIEIDHKNENKLENNFNNLRESTKSQNSSNIQLKRNNTSGYKGVCWSKRKRKWFMQIKANGVYKTSYHKDIIEAAKAYNVAAMALHGPFAKLNVV